MSTSRRAQGLAGIARRIACLKATRLFEILPVCADFGGSFSFPRNPLAEKRRETTMDMNRPDYNLSQNEVLDRYSTFRTGLSPGGSPEPSGALWREQARRGQEKDCAAGLPRPVQGSHRLDPHRCCGDLHPVRPGRKLAGHLCGADPQCCAGHCAVPQGGKVAGIAQGHELPHRHPAPGRPQGAGALPRSGAR